MLTILKYWQYCLAAVAILVLSSFISYCMGVSHGRELERNEQVVIGAKEATKSTVQREKIENETRKLDSPAIDRVLVNGGWMRSDTDR